MLQKHYAGLENLEYINVFNLSYERNVLCREVILILPISVIYCCFQNLITLIFATVVL